MSAERKVEPSASAWRYRLRGEGFPWVTTTSRAFAVDLPAIYEVEELLPLDAARLVWAERLEASVGCLHCSWINSDVVHKYCDVCYGKLRAADWLRSQDGAR
jgi:hypothetical protein